MAAGFLAVLGPDAGELVLLHPETGHPGLFRAKCLTIERARHTLLTAFTGPGF